MRVAPRLIQTHLQPRLDLIIPYKNLYHMTNVGMLFGRDTLGQPITAQEAYEYYIGASHPLIEKVLLTSSVGTAIWNTFKSYTQDARDGVERNPYAPAKENIALSVYEYFAPTFEALRRIAALADEFGSQHYLLVFPSLGEGCSDVTSEPVREVSDELNPIYFDDLTQNEFQPSPSCHMNSEGHRFVADRLLGVLQRLGG